MCVRSSELGVSVRNWNMRNRCYFYWCNVSHHEIINWIISGGILDRAKVSAFVFVHGRWIWSMYVSVGRDPHEITGIALRKAKAPLQGEYFGIYIFRKPLRLISENISARLFANMILISMIIRRISSRKLKAMLWQSLCKETALETNNFVLWNFGW